MCKAAPSLPQPPLRQQRTSCLTLPVPPSSRPLRLPLKHPHPLPRRGQVFYATTCFSRYSGMYSEAIGIGGKMHNISVFLRVYFSKVRASVPVAAADK
jgi:hypothetical protein